ncbi:hypothetical protein CsSME_00030256 [Camellia sinensis var. sinensis]
MMKWGRKKPCSSSMSHVFPMSWLSKFKPKGTNSDHKPMKPNQKPEPNFVFRSNPKPATWKDGRFYGGSDDSDWRLSFGEDRPRGEKSTVGLQSVWYESDEELQFPVGSKMAGREETWKFNDMVPDIRNFKRELPPSLEISPEIVACNRVEKEREFRELKVQRRKAVKDQKSRSTIRRVLGEKLEELEENSTVPLEKDIFELEPIRIVEKTDSDSGKHFYVSSVNCAFEALNLEETDGIGEEKQRSEWEKLKEMKMKELISKSEKQRKSVYINRQVQRRTKQSSKVKVYSPRIKALEDMKKAKMKMKKKAKEVEDRTAFDSFAVVKSSFDPDQDFRNSMIEMINERGIRKAEELEELLACYLTLNADEYHDLIIEVFRQVWFELKLESFSPELHNAINIVNYD